MPRARLKGHGPTMVLVLAAMLLVTASFGDDARPHVILYRDNALTVRVEGVKNSEILDEVARQSGAEIRGELRTTRDVSAEFESIPLPQAFARMFGDQNFALVYDRRGALKAVLLLHGSQGTGAVMRVKRPAPFPGSLTALLNGHPPVPVAGAVAEALGAKTATFSQLIDLSLHHDSAAVRAEALQTGMAAIEGEPPLSTALATELNRADSAQLVVLLRRCRPRPGGRGGPQHAARDPQRGGPREGILGVAAVARRELRPGQAGFASGSAVRT